MNLKGLGLINQKVDAPSAKLKGSDTTYHAW